MIGDDESVNPVVLRELRISVFELLDLFWIQHMKILFKAGEFTCFTEKVHEIIAVNGCRFHTDDYFGNEQLTQYRNDLVNEELSAGTVVGDRENTVFFAVRLHDAGNIVFAAHINAHKKCIVQ